MSTDQPTLSEFADASRGGQARTRPPQWATKQTDAQNKCQQCGSHVSADFARVMGDREGVAHACPVCSTSTELARGAAADGGGHDE